MSRSNVVLCCVLVAMTTAGAAAPAQQTEASAMNASDLPAGPAPAAVRFDHFPDRLHAYVWRNWQLVSTERLAQVIGAKPEDIIAIGKSLGLSDAPAISEDQWRRSYITILRRNWHLLPYDQLLALLDWTPAHLDYALREGDGLFWWFGGYKPTVQPLRYAPPDANAQALAARAAQTIRETFPDGVDRPQEPLFQFVKDLSSPLPASEVRQPANNHFSPRFCYCYFAPFRGPLEDLDANFPDGYLARLAAAGIDGVWLHLPLYEVAAFPWDASLSEGYEQNLENLAKLVARAKAHGVGVYIYLNEPRPMPVAFFKQHPELKGVEDSGVLPGQVACLCTSLPEVRQYLRTSMATLCSGVPDLAGVFTITASENYTNCWSHYEGQKCPRCATRPPAEVIAEVNTTIWEGIQDAGGKQTLFIWDWGWNDEWAEAIIPLLPKDAALQSVSEWSIPIERGGVKTQTGEYSLSVIGPGPRATRHWELARNHGMKTMAKLQASTTWELGSVPYMPVVANIAQHVANLRSAQVNGVMLSWTLGGYPSPSFEAVLEIGRMDTPDPDEAMRIVAARRFGGEAAPAVVAAWKAFSAAIQEYPFSTAVLYNSPVHMGPANLLWRNPTGYPAGMIKGFAYPLDCIDAWRNIYPPGAFADQFQKIADGFDAALASFQQAVPDFASNEALRREFGVAEACALHFRSVANQTRFVMLRDRLAAASGQEEQAVRAELRAIVENERALAIRLHAIQSRDSRIGFEAACQYFYIGSDLGEKVLNCDCVLARL